MHDRHHRPFAASLPLYPFRDQKHKQRFLALVRGHLGRGGQEVVIRDGHAAVAGSAAVHGLTNLAQVCHQAPPEQWPAIIAEHLDKGRDERCAAIVTEHLDGDFARAADRLAVRIYGEDFATGPIGQQFVHRVDLPGSCTVLVLDIGQSIMPVPAPIASAWAVPVPDLFARALDNLPRLGTPHWTRLPLPPGCGPIDVFSGDFHASAHVLRAATFAGRSGAHGNLVCVPACEVLVSHPIDALPSATTIEAMVRIANGKFRDGPGSITPDPYWRAADGTFHRQQGCIDGRRARFVPSAELVELLERLRSGS